MAKKDDSLDDWRYRYPSAGVSWNLIPDPASCQQFVGEAKNMLYRLKNRMNIAVPKLKSLQDIRSPAPGTTIIVRSIFGQDFIEISAGVGVAGGKEICTITFIDIPLYVPPMRNPGEIKLGEVQGVDYFKTYYSVDISKCPTCQVTSWEFLFRYLQSSPLVPLPKPPLPISTRIEWPIEPLHHHDYDADGLLLDHDGTDHTIYSLSPPAWGEVISYGTDDGGTYIIWKAYTETGSISRTGLGIMRLVARIKDDKGIEICAQNERIKVDCCLKDDALRAVEIWWEDSGTCQPFIIYPGVLYNAICLMPTSVSYSELVWYGCTHPQQPLYAIPEILGSCLPVEWTLTGAIALLDPDDKNDNIIFFKCIEGGCNEQAIITLRDRCGTEYIVRGSPCCEDAAELSIGYTSLLMSCGGQQTFTASGGCGPYTFSVTSGGGTIDEDTGVYTAPATNANCTDNPTIEVTDCCGNSASVGLAVNCYVGGPAYRECLFLMCTDSCPSWFKGEWCAKRYNCDGTLMNINPYHCGGYQPECLVCKPSTQCNCPVSTWNNPCGGTFWGQCIGPNQECGTTLDIRTQAMKDSGCCPINPLTGLPY